MTGVDMKGVDKEDEETKGKKMRYAAPSPGKSSDVKYRAPDEYEEERKMYRGIILNDPGSPYGTLDDVYNKRSILDNTQLFRQDTSLFADKNLVSTFLFNCKKRNGHLQQLKKQFLEQESKENDPKEREELAARHYQFLKKQIESECSFMNQFESKMMEVNSLHGEEYYTKELKQLNDERETLKSALSLGDQEKMTQETQDTQEETRRFIKEKAEHKKQDEIQRKQYAALNQNENKDVAVLKNVEEGKQKSTGVFSKIMYMLSGQSSKKAKEDYAAINESLQGAQKGVFNNDKSAITFGTPCRLVADCNAQGLITQVNPPTDGKPFMLVTKDKDGKVLDAMSFDEKGNFISYRSWDTNGRESTAPHKDSGFSKNFIESQQKAPLKENLRKKSVVESGLGYLASPFSRKFDKSPESHSR